MDAIGAARSGGATFADARIGRYRRQFLNTREQQIVNVVDNDTMGIGVRVLLRGTWGFAATRELTTDGVARAVREALGIARANRESDIPGRRGRAPTSPIRGTFPSKRRPTSYCEPMRKRGRSRTSAS